VIKLEFYKLMHIGMRTGSNRFRFVGSVFRA